MSKSKPSKPKKIKPEHARATRDGKADSADSAFNEKALMVFRRGLEENGLLSRADGHPTQGEVITAAEMLFARHQTIIQQRNAAEQNARLALADRERMKVDLDMVRARRGEAESSVRSLEGFLAQVTQAAGLLATATTPIELVLYVTKLKSDAEKFRKQAATTHTHHNLKTWPEPFQAILDGKKTCEIRKCYDPVAAPDERKFHAGDTLTLSEYDPEASGRVAYTGRAIKVEVTDVRQGWGLPAGLCVLSFKILVTSPRMPSLSLSDKFRE
jgi:hypothetical protein